MRRPRDRRIGCWLAVALALGCSSERSPWEPDYLFAVRDGQIVDAEGSVLFLRGINVREDAKYHQDFLIPLSLAERNALRTAGVNSVRLLTHWQAVSPAEGELDQDYLARYAAEASALAADGFYVICDMHQDLWGVPFGDGGADWTCPEEIKAGWEPLEPWWANYTTEQVRGCFDRFWQQAELQDRWIAAWEAVAGAVCDNQRVLGFDLFNEPFPGSALSDPRFDPDTLYPFYLRAADRIAAVCPGRVFFLEPSMSFTLGLADVMQAAEADRARTVFAPHFYPSDVHEPGQTYSRSLSELRISLLTALGGYFGSSSPVWIGEYGGQTANEGAADYFEQITTLLYENFIGSALWAFNRRDDGYAFLDSSGSLKEVFRRAWSLPVPVRLPAVPGRMQPDFENGALALELACKTGAELELLLAGNGRFRFEIVPEGALELSEQDGRRVVLTCARSLDVQIDVLPQ